MCDWGFNVTVNGYGHIGTVVSDVWDDIVMASSPITQTCPCIMQRFLKAVKMLIFILKIVIIFLFLLKTKIVGTETVLTVPTIYILEQN